ncbi:hypothetical protein B0H12DRAFT_1105317 [Mycena haematopus]|nr:hypothetical protein B0H12DRAFT_1105317 [Mycena haematopus]
MGVSPDRIYGMDESGFPTGYTGKERVVGARGTKTQHKRVDDVAEPCSTTWQGRRGREHRPWAAPRLVPSSSAPLKLNPTTPRSSSPSSKMSRAPFRLRNGPLQHLKRAKSPKCHGAGTNAGGGECDNDLPKHGACKAVQGQGTMPLV